MKVALVNVKTRKGAINKDLSGGFGTSSDFGGSLFSRLVGFVKKNSVHLPIVSSGYVAAQLKKRGYEVVYVEGMDCSEDIDVYLIYTSLIEHRAEIQFAKKVKDLGKRVGFYGSFASVEPNIFLSLGDFVVVGEAENCLDHLDLNLAAGIIQAGAVSNIELLPFPDWSSMPYEKFSYKHYLPKTPIFPILTSRGCPFSCGFYCPYPVSQGNRVRSRSAKNVVDEMEYLRDHFGAKGFLFRDPVFTINRARAVALAEEMIVRKVNLPWVCETHLASLDIELIKLFYTSGLRGINVGIESSSEEVKNKAHRKSDEIVHQEMIIKFCEDMGIKIGAFYIFGNLSDTEESIENTIDYAKRLNTSYAQFTLCTPYPGTQFYEQIKDKIFENNWDKFDIYTPTFTHPNLKSSELIKLKERAYSAYYLRMNWLFKHFTPRF